MAFEKYKARKAATKALRSHSSKELELEYMKLCKPSPPSYDDIYDPTASDPDATTNRQQSTMTVPMRGGIAPKPFALTPNSAMQRAVQTTAAA